MGFEMRPFNNSFFDINPNDFFKDFGRQLAGQFPGNQSIKTDITELDDKYVVEAELPGMSKENISLNFEDNVLTIEGKQEVDNKEEDENGRVIHRERSFSNVSRQFSFDDVDQDNISASYENGMLNITLPKIEADKRTNHNIQID
ncbi:HSP20 family protein [Staphylococcus auricularis]|uniref:Hsp20/alpha crystallin family protein n=1 Tax=Staphylococcus auricularis TaxID=29379 RepID=A0AAP8TTG7_9STAP|nr:Hsp20/alpha crystallin family protein [Staphylococcus auricularis]MBM0867405.1 Hsp20/alpha crystallin family protein [Staphylococcus auricularis]MCG7341268.1 Hsp20/alpha crystallin family protein [Staphylococcus auricularis]MDC6327675.1 Hsp20/alpha crystallin family protein [Staphylococcus auricularis]MDN4533627.1 Hsp20/alpha crystallin family protein [Staphylococcus auricularis]MEB6570192.1 Hsp20/alpha crystallin family protein [Staphylococcus auricularis]